MKITLLLLILLLSVATCFAQKEATHWYFGSGAGIVFINDNPSPISGKMFTEEGCATISDRTTGALQFYTNGDSVWNSNHTLIQDGIDLLGGVSSSQCALVVPVIGKNSQYYLFTAPDLTSGVPRSVAMHYSIVDMQLNKQSGGFVNKNVPLLDSASERIACTFDNSKSGYWVVVHHSGKLLFYAYHITAKGIAAPVISAYQPNINIPIKDRDAGCMKISPNGKKLAITSGFMGFFYLFDFDNRTGKVSNFLDLFPRPKPTSPPIEAYGLSFSPDNSKLYGFYRFENALEADICQFEVDKGDNASILASKVLITDETESRMRWAWRAMQLAPNGKIYCTRNGNPYLSAIRKPNLKGNACEFRETEVTLLSNSEAGLPCFIDSWFGKGMTDTVICAGGVARIGLPGLPGVTYQWNPSSSLSNPTAPVTDAMPTVTTTYSRTATDPSGDITVDNITVTVDKPIADAGEDKAICLGSASLPFKIGSEPLPGYSYSWLPLGEIENPDSAKPTIRPTKNTQYIVKATSPYGCFVFDTIEVTIGKIKKLISVDTSICNGSSVQLMASGGESYSWFPTVGLDNPSIPNPKATPDTTTIYRVTIQSGTCTDSDFVTIKVVPLPKANAGIDNIFCESIPIRLGEPAIVGNEYLWQPSAGLDNPTKADPYASPTVATRYILTVTNGICTTSDTVLVTVGDIVAKVSNDTAVCVGTTVQLFASGAANYVWSPSTGLSNPTIANPVCTAESLITYSVIVSNGTCSDTGYVTVDILPLPIANAGKNTFICESTSVGIGELPRAGNTYSWSPSAGLSDPTKADPYASPTVTTGYILTVTNGICSATDTVFVTVGDVIAKVSDDTAVCIGTAVQLLASGGANYQWSPSTGLSNPTIANPLCTVDTSITYRVIATNGMCSDTGYIKVNILPVPVANAGKDTVICKSTGAQIGDLPSAGNTYSWSPSIGLNNAFLSNPIAAPSETVRYIVSVQNTSGCMDYDTVLVTVYPQNERKFTLNPPVVPMTPGQPVQTTLHIPDGISSWKIQIGYNDLIVKFDSILETRSGIKPDVSEQPKQLSLSGKVGDDDILIRFNTYLPYNSDTAFAMTLTLDSAEIQQCETATAKGSILDLGEFCGRNLRMVKSTLKSYFLKAEETGVNFGIGLSGKVRLEVYDYTGVMKEVLVDDYMEAGEYSVNVDLPAGVYFGMFSAGQFIEVKKVIITK